MEVLTVVLAILADGGFGRRCQVTVGNKEICLEDAEALGFLREEDDKSYRKEVDGPDDDKRRGSGNRNLC